MIEISRNKIPEEVLEFMREQNRRGVSHKQISKRVENKFKLTINEKEIGKLIMAADDGVDESSQYKVE